MPIKDFFFFRCGLIFPEFILQQNYFLEMLLLLPIFRFIRFRWDPHITRQHLLHPCNFSLTFAFILCIRVHRSISVFIRFFRILCGNRFFTICLKHVLHSILFGIGRDFRFFGTRLKNRFRFWRNMMHHCRRFGFCFRKSQIKTETDGHQTKDRILTDRIILFFFKSVFLFKIDFPVLMI